jgi:hypothetical protein
MLHAVAHERDRLRAELEGIKRRIGRIGLTAKEQANLLGENDD